MFHFAIFIFYIFFLPHGGTRVPTTFPLSSTDTLPLRFLRTHSRAFRAFAAQFYLFFKYTAIHTHEHIRYCSAIFQIFCITSCFFPFPIVVHWCKFFSTFNIKFMLRYKCISFASACRLFVLHFLLCPAAVAAPVLARFCWCEKLKKKMRISLQFAGVARSQQFLMLLF